MALTLQLHLARYDREQQRAVVTALIEFGVGHDTTSSNTTCVCQSPPLREVDNEPLSKPSNRPWDRSLPGAPSTADPASKSDQRTGIPDQENSKLLQTPATPTARLNVPLSDSA